MNTTALPEPETETWKERGTSTVDAATGAPVGALVAEGAAVPEHPRARTVEKNTPKEEDVFRMARFDSVGSAKFQPQQRSFGSLSRGRSRLFGQLLFRLAARYRKARRVHLILDNYGIHKSHATQRVLESLGDRIVLHFLPPYCPDHNRIERVWLDFHANVTRNHRCRSLRELLDNVVAYLAAYRWRRPRDSRRFARAA